MYTIHRWRPYHAESRPITEVKQRRARLVLGWETETNSDLFITLLVLH